MIPYFIFLASVMLICWLTFRRGKISVWGLIILFFVMTLFAGLRSASVGTDSRGYANTFETGRFERHEIAPGLAGLADEPAFYFLEKWLSGLSQDYAVLFIGIAAIFCFFVLWSIGKNSRQAVFSLFVFITLGYYTFVFNAARQGLALAIYMMSIPSLMKRKFWQYAAIVLVAAMFHKTIIVAIPLYFVFTMRYSFLSVSLIIIGGLLIGWFLPILLEYSAGMEKRYELYLYGEAVGGYLLTAFYVILAGFFIYERQFIRKAALKEYDVFLHMLIIGSAIYLVVSLSGAYVELTRFAAYFQIGVIFLWAELAVNRRHKLPSLIYAVAIVGHLAYFVLYLSKLANLTPYTLNPFATNVIF